MLIIPAIDLMDNQCVRLYQGQFQQKTQYFTFPSEQAKEFESAGASMIHIVDLDGAREGKIRNFDSIRDIRNSVQLPLEIGGGIRNFETAKELFDMGLNRVVLGTSAVNNTSLISDILSEYGADALAIGIDTKNGNVATKGWETETNITAHELITSMFDLGVRWINYTDIDRDGTLSHPNFEAIKELHDAFPEMNIVASGGVSSLEDVEKLREIGVEGVIIGKAIYEGKIDLADLTQ